MPSRQPEEARGFKLLGHDRSAAWGGGSIVEVHKGYAYVGAVGGAASRTCHIGFSEEFLGEVPHSGLMTAEWKRQRRREVGL